MNEQIELALLIKESIKVNPELIGFWEDDIYPLALLLTLAATNMQDGNLHGTDFAVETIKIVEKSFQLGYNVGQNTKEGE